jgi:hypothetical protein
MEAFSTRRKVVYGVNSVHGQFKVEERKPRSRRVDQSIMVFGRSLPVSVLKRAPGIILLNTSFYEPQAVLCEVVVSGFGQKLGYKYLHARRSRGELLEAPLRTKGDNNLLKRYTGKGGPGNCAKRFCASCVLKDLICVVSL